LFAPDPVLTGRVLSFAAFLGARALYELGAAARWLAGGLKPRETAIAVAVPAVYVAPFAVLLWRIQAPLTRIAETVASAAFLTLSLLALLPIARRRFSWGLALMCSGSASCARSLTPL
jgi:hypothetical protein